jgi:organic radical activating enzyme
MNLLTVNLMSSCNFDCYYCPVKNWSKPVGYRFPDSGLSVNSITNEVLLKWLDKYLDPEKWLIEITGGEPGLYPEINALIPALDERGYKGVIKTNGSLPIPKSKNFQIIAAWHEGKEPPEYYDVMLIIENPNDGWHEKAEYCKSARIPYKTVMFDEYYLTRQVIPADRCFENKIIKYLHMNSMGQLSGCSRKPCDISCCISNMSEPPVFETLVKECPKCKNINDVVIFLPDEIMRKVEEDYLEKVGDVYTGSEIL